MKNLLVALTLLCASSLPARAENTAPKSSEILAALIAASPSAKLVSDVGEKFDLAEVLGQALAVDSLTGEIGQNLTINSVNGSCETVGAIAGGVAYKCQLQINNADYTISKTGFDGPLFESSQIFMFPATKKAGGKLRLHGKKVRVMVAG